MHTFKEDERRNFSDWWNEGLVAPGNNPYRHESAAYWAWEGWQAGTKAEREACAAFLDEYAKRDQSIAERQALEGYFDLSARTLGILLLSEKCLVEFLADKIRARGEE